MNKAQIKLEKRLAKIEKEVKKIDKQIAIREGRPPRL